MEPKKNPAYDVHRKSGMIFSFSLGCSLLIVLTALEWRTVEQNDGDPNKPTTTSAADDFVYPPVTVVDPPPASEAPKPASVKVINVNNIIEVSDAHKTALDERFPTADINPNTELDVSKYVIEVDKEEAETICLFPEKNAAPENGYHDFYEQLRKNLKYPVKARRMNTQGKVFIEFVVNEMGALSNIHVLKGIGDGCDEEAIRVLQLTKWKPGKQRGKPVKVKMVLPIIFSLSGGY